MTLQICNPNSPSFKCSQTNNTLQNDFKERLKISGFVREKPHNLKSISGKGRL